MRFRISKRYARQIRQVLPPGLVERGVCSLRRWRVGGPGDLPRALAGGWTGRPPQSAGGWVDRETSPERTRREMEDRCNAIQHLAHEGLNTPAIARTRGLNWQTVRKYLTDTTPPQRPYTVRPTRVLMPYQAYILGRWATGILGRWATGILGRWATGILGRWATGCHNTRQLWREMAAQGYAGGYRPLARLTS